MTFRTGAGTILVQGRTGGAPLGGAVGSSPTEEMWRAAVRRRQGPRPQTTSTIPTGRIGNDRPIEITDERWESPELRMLIYSRNSDPRTGVVEYRLTNINRSEPPADLFMIPQNRIQPMPPLPPAPPPAPPGTRGRGAAHGRTGTTGR